MSLIENKHVNQHLSNNLIINHHIIYFTKFGHPSIIHSSIINIHIIWLQNLVSISLLIWLQNLVSLSLLIQYYLFV